MLFSTDNLQRKSLCVIGGQGKRFDEFLEGPAAALGFAMAKAGIGFVCYGTIEGLTRVIAKEIRRHGGHITCISHFEYEESDVTVDDFIVTGDFHDSKTQMFQISSGFVALPGTVETLEVLMEYLTWMQRIYQRKPVYIVNFNNFWGPLIQLFEHMNEEAFLPRDFHLRYILVNEITDVVPHFLGY
ncbi:LOG family protein [Mucilaginibacter sp. AW1-3]